MNTWKRALACAAATPLALAGLATNPASAVTSNCAEFTVPVTRLISKTGGALLTQFSDEVRTATGFGFGSNEGVVAKTAASAGTGLVGVWRAYNSWTHDFTWAAEGADLNKIKAKGYTAQFRQFYAATAGNGCLSAAYRLSYGPTTRIAIGATDRDKLTAKGWKVADSAPFYAVAGTSTTPIAKPPAQPIAPAPNPPGNNVAADEFTVAVIPDTQQETWSDGDTRFKNRSTWLVNNASRLNLKFATHVGDVVDWGNVTPAQYTRAKNGLSPLNGKIPYSLTLGNHDTGAVCAGGSACPGKDARLTVRDTSVFNKEFPASTFTNLKGQFEAGKVDNAYSTFSAGGRNWMVLNLELWPRPAAVEWAKKVVASHADYNVIVASHAYLDGGGNIDQTNGGYGSTSGQYLYDHLIKVYPNIKVVLSGHVGESAARADTGVNGNKIISYLQCFHSRTTNPVRLLTINVAKGTITDSIYAPYTGQTLSASTTKTGFNFTR